MSLNSELSRGTVYYVIVTFSLAVIALFLYIFLISPSIKTKNELKESYEYSKSINTRLEEPKQENKDLTENIILNDNKYYDSFYNSLVNLTKDYGFDYFSLSNYYLETNSKLFYPMIAEGQINLGNASNFNLLSHELDHKLLDFQYDVYEQIVKFKNLFVFDSSYSQKDIEIDNRNFEKIEDNSNDELLNKEESSDNNVFESEISKPKDIVNKNIFNFTDKNEELYFTPMHENLIIDWNNQVSPVINKESIMVNAINISNNDAVCLVDFSRLNFKIFFGDISIYLNDYIYDNKGVRKFLYCKDYNGTYYDIEGSYIDGKTYFSIDDNFQFPITILGLKYKLESSSSVSFALMDIGYEINKNRYDDFIKNGKFSTVLKYKDIDIDSFLNEIGGKIDKAEFIKDNSLTKDSYRNAKILLVRFRELYEIK